MNALNRQVQDESGRGPRGHRRSEVKAVIVYGGEKVFAAGADIKEMAEMTSPQMARSPAPAVGARRGRRRSRSRPSRRSPATRSAADSSSRWARTVRIAGDNAKLGQPEILLGVIPGARRHPAPGPPGRPGQGQGHRVHRPLRRRRRGAARSAWSTRSSPADEVYTAARDVGVAVRRRPGAGARRREGRDRPRASTRTWHRA